MSISMAYVQRREYKDQVVVLGTESWMVDLRTA
jgi:hypothetical protein